MIHLESVTQLVGWSGGGIHLESVSQLVGGGGIHLESVSQLVGGGGGGIHPESVSQLVGGCGGIHLESVSQLVGWRGGGLSVDGKSLGGEGHCIIWVGWRGVLRVSPCIWVREEVVGSVSLACGGCKQDSERSCVFSSYVCVCVRVCA